MGSGLVQSLRRETFFCKYYVLSIGWQRQSASAPTTTILFWHARPIWHPRGKRRKQVRTECYFYTLLSFHHTTELNRKAKICQGFDLKPFVGPNSIKSLYREVYRFNVVLRNSWNELTILPVSPCDQFRELARAGNSRNEIWKSIVCEPYLIRFYAVGRVHRSSVNTWPNKQALSWLNNDCRSLLLPAIVKNRTSRKRG